MDRLGGRSRYPTDELLLYRYLLLPVACNCILEKQQAYMWRSALAWTEYVNDAHVSITCAHVACHLVAATCDC